MIRQWITFIPHLAKKYEKFWAKEMECCHHFKLIPAQWVSTFSIMGVADFLKAWKVVHDFATSGQEIWRKNMPSKCPAHMALAWNLESTNVWTQNHHASLQIHCRLVRESYEAIFGFQKQRWPVFTVTSHGQVSLGSQGRRAVFVASKSICRMHRIPPSDCNPPASKVSRVTKRHLSSTIFA